MECFRVSERSLDQHLLVLTLDDPAHTRATRHHTVNTRDRTGLLFLIFLHFPTKGTEALPAPGQSNPPFPGSSPARGEEAESSGCSPFPPRLPGESSVCNSHPCNSQGCREAQPELKPGFCNYIFPFILLGVIGESVSFCVAYSSQSWDTLGNTCAS